MKTVRCKKHSFDFYMSCRLCEREKYKDDEMIKKCDECPGTNGGHYNYCLHYRGQDRVRPNACTEECSRSSWAGGNPGSTLATALNDQVGGEHYKNKPIQPIEYCHKNKLGPCESAVVKYVTRWREKNGIEDLKKAKHYIDLLIEMEGKP